MCATKNQLARGLRRKSPDDKRAAKGRGIRPQPQYSGVVLSRFDMSPTKPNSANRHVVKVQLKSVRVTSDSTDLSQLRGAIVIAYLPGERNRVQSGAKVIIEAGQIQDLIGVRYKVVLVGDTAQQGRKNARSKYGTKKPDKTAGA